MDRPLQLGRKALALLLIVTLLGASFYPPENHVHAAPFIPGGQTAQGAGTLEGLLEQRAGKTPGFQVDEKLLNVPSKYLDIPIMNPPGSTGITSYGVRGLAVWESPNRFLLRWVPDDDWIPEEGYSLFRIIAGQPVGLIDGLGTAKTSTTQVQNFNRKFASATQLPGTTATTPSLSTPKPSSTTSVKRYGDGLFTQEDLAKAVANLRTNAAVTDQVRQALKQRQLLGSDQSSAAVEKALISLRSSSVVAGETEIISGQGEFASRFRSRVNQKTSPQFVLPSQNADPGKAALPIVENKIEMAKVMELQTPQQSAQQDPVYVGQVNDPLDTLVSARKDLLTLANLNFRAALEAGLGYVDTVDGLRPGVFVDYFLLPTATLRSLLSGRTLFDPNRTIKPQISVEFGQALTVQAPLNLQGYAMDHKAYLRWDDAIDNYTRNILSGFVVERKLAGEKSFTALNPDQPVVKMYAKDAAGNLLEPDVLYTDEALANGASATYQIRAVDVFGRASAPCPAVDLTVFKTIPPATPSMGLSAMAKDPDLGKPVLAAVSPVSVGAEELQTLRQRGKITQSQYDKLIAHGSLDEDLLLQQVSSGLLTQAQFNELLQITGKSAELARRSGLESRIAQLRQSSTQKSGAVLIFSHSVVANGTAVSLEEGLKEYRLYRSEALGKGSFSDPTLVSTVALSQLALPYGSATDPRGDLIYYDTNVSPGHYYAYWVTAVDSSGNESPVQSKPQIVAYPSEVVPGAPQNPENQFKVNEALTTPQPKVAGFSERVKLKTPEELFGPVAAGFGPSPGLLDLGNDKYLHMVMQKELHRLVLVGADEVNADGSVTVGWLPSSDSDLVGYLIYRAHDPAGSALQTPPTEADLDRMQWSLINVNKDPDKLDIEEEQVLTTNQLRDKLPLPATGCYLYQVFLIESDTYGAPAQRENEESPYVEGGRVTIQWSASTDPQVAGYRVYRSEVPREVVEGTQTGFVPRWDMIAQLVTDAQYVDVVDQSRVHFYQYKVATVSIWGVESPAATIANPLRISTTIPPAVPGLLTPISQPGQVQLRWKPVYDATKYTIYRAEQSIPELKPIDLANAVLEAAQQRSRKSAAVPDALRDKLVKLAQELKDVKDEDALRAKIAEIIEGLSAEEQLSLFNILRKRLGILALAPYSQLDQKSASEITWKPLYTHPITHAANEGALASGEVMTWTDTSVQYPSLYMYAIEAENEDRLTSGLSSPVTVGPQKDTGPAAPDPVTLRQDGGLVQLSWKAYTSKTPMGYLVYKSLAKDGQYQQCSPLLETNAFSENLELGEEWWYRVVIIDEVGLTSAATNPVKASRPFPILLPDTRPGGLTPGGTKPGTLPGRTGTQLPPIQKTSLQAPAFAPLPMAVSKPTAPVISAGETGSTTVALSWPAADGVTQYKVYGYRTEQPEKLLATANGKAGSCIVTGLTASTRYYFYVIAVNELGESLSSKVVSATTKAPSTTQPQWGKLALEVTATTPDSVTLSWTDTGAAPEGYKIYYYKTEQPEQLLQVVSGSTTSFTAKGLTANTKYYFYITAYKDGKDSLPSNVASGIAKVQTTPNPLPGPTPNPLPTPSAPGSTIKIAGYTVANVRKLPVLGTTGSAGEQIVGQLTIAGLSPIPVGLDIQELSGETLTKGSISLLERYEHKQGDAQLVIEKLSLTGAGPAKISGRLTIPGVTPITLNEVALSADGKITLDVINGAWVGEYQLSHLKAAKAQFFGPEPGLWADSGWLESSLGQITLTNQRLQISSASSIRIDFGGRITGLFDKVVSDGKPIDLVVPRLTGLTIEKATIKLLQGVVDPQASQIVGKYNLPFVTGELTSTVITPTDNSGANQPPTPGRDQEQISNPGDMYQRFNYGSISSNSTVKGLNEQGQKALQGSMNHLLQSIKGAATANITASAPMQNQGQNGFMLMSMSNTFTMRYFSSIPFAITAWDGKGIVPGQEQNSPLDKVLVKELQNRSAIVSGGGMDKSGILQLEAAKTKLSLPAYQLASAPEQVSIGGPGYRGFEILEGFVTLPPTNVTLRNPAQGTTYRLPVPASTLFYSRNGLIGRVDTEATAGTSADIWLNREVAATMSGAAIDLESNKVQWAMSGTITVPQLGKDNGVDRMVRYGAFTDPQGGLIFRVEPEKAAVTSSSGRSIQITGGMLKGSDLYLDGRLSVSTRNVTLTNMDFVSLRLYMGKDQAKQQAPDYGQGLAAKPVEAKIKDFTMETRGVKVEQNRDGIWEFAVVGATALVNNLPLNEGTVINLDTDLDAKAGTFKAKLNYTYEQFLTIDVDVKYENGEFRGEGEFWFITGDEGDENRSQATGTVQARVGSKDGVDYWLFKLAYGQSTKTWKCEKCGFEFEGNRPPIKCPGTKGGKPCDGKKDDFKTDWQCSLCKKVVHAKEAPKACDGQKDGKKCKGAKDDFKQVSKPKTKEDAAGAGLMLGPVQINNIMAMMGYNVELPKAKNGTYDVPVGFDNDQKLYEWKTLNNGDMFFVAKAYMTIWHDGERFLTLEPVRLVIASGPAVEMEASIKREGKQLAYGKIGYYHEDRRFFLQVKVPKIELPGIEARLEDLNLLLDFSPKKQIVNLSYPEMVKLYLPGMPWDFAGGFAYEHIDGNYAIKMKARAQYGFDEEFSILYIKAKVGLTVDANLNFPKGPNGETLFDFQLMVMLEGDLKGGVKIDDYVHEILHAYVSLQGYLGKTVRNEWWVYGKAYIYYHIGLWLWEKEGSEEWTVGKVPEGVKLIEPTLAKDEKKPDKAA